MNNAANKLEITRTINAPRDLVFRVWTQSEHLAKWWGPEGSTLDVTTFELTPGGKFSYCMKTGDGFTLWAQFVYKEITASEKLIFVSAITDEKGNLSAHPMMPTWPAEILNTLTFTEKDGKTEMSYTAEPVNATDVELKTFAEALEGVKMGYNSTFDKLVKHAENL